MTNYFYDVIGFQLYTEINPLVSVVLLKLFEDGIPRFLTWSFLLLLFYGKKQFIFVSCTILVRISRSLSAVSLACTRLFSLSRSGTGEFVISRLHVVL